MAPFAARSRYTYIYIYMRGNPQPEAIGIHGAVCSQNSGAGTMHSLQPCQLLINLGRKADMQTFHARCKHACQIPRSATKFFCLHGHCYPVPSMHLRQEDHQRSCFIVTTVLGTYLITQGSSSRDTQHSCVDKTVHSLSNQDGLEKCCSCPVNRPVLEAPLY